MTPITQAPVRWQTLSVNLEVLAPWNSYKYDIASIAGTLLVENQQAQKYTFVLPFPTIAGGAEIRVITTDEKAKFKNKGTKPEDFSEILKHLGEIPLDDQPILEEIKKSTKHFQVAEIEIPAGSQVLYFHAHQVILPTKDNPRRFELTLFAPLAGLVLNPSGAVNMSLTAAFPPADYAAPGLTVDTANIKITSLPNQDAPPAAQEGPVTVAKQIIYGWHWQKDPKITIPYDYK